MKKAAGGAEASSEQQGIKEEQQDQWIKKQSWEKPAISPGPGTACATPATVPGKTHSPCSSPRQSPMCHHHSIQSSREWQQEPQIVKKIISGGMQQSGNQATGMLAGMAFEHWTTRHTSLKHGGQTRISSLLCTSAALPASQCSSHSNASSSLNPCSPRALAGLLQQQQPTGPAASCAVPPEISSRSFVHLRGRGIKTSMGEKIKTKKKQFCQKALR